MNKINNKTSRSSLFTFGSIVAVGGFFGTWSLMTLLSSLNKVQWNVIKLYEQYMIATNQLGLSPSPVDPTVCSSYSDYIFALFPLCLIPIFLRYLNTRTDLTES